MKLKSVLTGKLERINPKALLAAVIVINVFLDRITKFAAVHFLEGRAPVMLLKKTVVFMYAENNGAFLSMGADWPAPLKYSILLCIPILICITVFVYLLFKEQKRYRLVAGGTIIAGGLSNLFDRLFNGFYVIDFMNFGIGSIRTGVLNVADLSVSFGAVCLLLCERKEARK